MTGDTIYERENEADALLYAHAFRHRYALARRWRGARIVTGALIGTVGVVVALMAPATADYIAAIAAGWIVFGRVVLAPNEVRERRCGAIAQELFDTHALDLPWSASVAGPRPAHQDVRRWGRRHTKDDVRDWWPDVSPAPHPLDVLICQRATITWARQDHAMYARVLRWGAGLAFAATVVLGLVLGLTLGDYLLRLGVPVLPAVLDILDIGTDNADLAKQKTHLELEARALFDQALSTPESITAAQCRDVQNGIFATRLRPGVPNWLYQRTRKNRQEDMEDVVRREVASLPYTLQG